MGASITLAGESLIAQKLGAQERLEVVRFVFANVPGLDSGAPVDRAAAKPPAEQIVHHYTIPQQNIGFVNPNQVVYSSMLGSDIGDFDWNWMGLETAEDVLLAVAYMPLQQKRKNIPPLQLGNNVTRNVLVAFDGAQALTAITIDASTWQHDFTVRLAGIDERERRSNREMYGRACFFGDALALTHDGTAFQLNAGTAYVEGIRVQLDEPYDFVTGIAGEVYLDVCLGRELNDRVATWALQFGEWEDYTDSAGVRHYCVPIADFLNYSQITDLRVVEPITGPVIQHMAARNGDYRHLRARATTKADVELDQIPNAISNDSNTDDPWILATTRMVQAVRTHLYAGIKALMDGTTAAGIAIKLATTRTFRFSGAATGSATFDGSADVEVGLTLADSGVQPGTYTKVTLNAKGLVTYAGSLHAVDIPSLSWISHIVDKPTTADGYGLTDVLVVGKPFAKKPILFSHHGGTDWTYSALEIRECGLVANTQSHFDFAPRIAFHWGAVNAGALGMASNGELCWNGQRLWTQANFEPTTVVPAGAIIAFCHGHVFDGYLKANGAAVSRTAYARLFNLFGTHYGAGDGHSTFNLPDLRGEFIRGLDEGRGLDPGRGMGTHQDSQNLWHDHSASSDVQGEHTHGILPISLNIATGLGAGHFSVGNTLSLNSGAAGSHAHNITVHGSGGNESRPPNIAMVYCIKY